MTALRLLKTVLRLLKTVLRHQEHGIIVCCVHCRVMDD
jgi:hypothetical protein